MGHATAGNDSRHRNAPRDGGGRHPGARYLACLARDRLPVPGSTPPRMAARDAAGDSRLRARLRVARHAPGAARRPRRQVDLAVRAGAHDHPVPLRLPVCPRGVSRAVAALHRRRTQPRMQPVAGVLARRAADGTPLARRRRSTRGHGGAHRRGHRAAVQRVDDCRRRVARVVRYRQPQRGRRARRAPHRHRHRPDRHGAPRAGGLASRSPAHVLACTSNACTASGRSAPRRSGGRCSHSRSPCRFTA